jgi:hypothetical protein
MRRSDYFQHIFVSNFKMIDKLNGLIVHPFLQDIDAASEIFEEPKC